MYWEILELGDWEIAIPKSYQRVNFTQSLFLLRLFHLFLRLTVVSLLEVLNGSLKKTDHASKILVENSKFHFTLIYLFLWLPGDGSFAARCAAERNHPQPFFSCADVDRNDGLFWRFHDLCH